MWQMVPLVPSVDAKDFTVWGIGDGNLGGLVATLKIVGAARRPANAPRLGSILITSDLLGATLPAPSTDDRLGLLYRAGLVVRPSV